jgi:uncharacterized protein YjbJ (UPF0337 family)
LFVCDAFSGDARALNHAAIRSAIMVTQQTLEGSWNEIKGQLQEKWGQLTDDELQNAKGNAKQLVGLIQRKTGQAREEVEKYLDWIVADGQSAVQRGTEAAQQFAQQAGAQAQEVYHQASERVQQGFHSAERAVARRPVESVAVAFGSGLIAGVIVGLVLRSK